MRELARVEIEALQARREQTESDLKLLLVPSDPNDEKNVILEIRAGTGGDEASLFAADILRMYARYAERQRWKMEILDASETGIGGIKEAVALIEGDKVYSKLKHESGVHRVQRVPQTEASGRIHTSAITVAILPEAEDVDVKIDPKDLRIDTFCSSGPGGQSVNTTYSAVRITQSKNKSSTRLSRATGVRWWAPAIAQKRFAPITSRKTVSPITASALPFISSIR